MAVCVTVCEVAVCVTVCCVCAQASLCLSARGFPPHTATSRAWAVVAVAPVDELCSKLASRPSKESMRTARLQSRSSSSSYRAQHRVQAGKASSTWCITAHCSSGRASGTGTTHGTWLIRQSKRYRYNTRHMAHQAEIAVQVQHTAHHGTRHIMQSEQYMYSIPPPYLQQGHLPGLKHA